MQTKFYLAAGWIKIFICRGYVNFTVLSFIKFYLQAGKERLFSFFRLWLPLD